jgi:hypothetical protein
MTVAILKKGCTPTVLRRGGFQVRMATPSSGHATLTPSTYFRAGAKDSALDDRGVDPPAHASVG